MITMLLVARREIVTLLRRPSFYIGAAIVPIMIAAITLGSSFAGDAGSGILSDSDVGPGAPTPSGYVDQASVIRVVPPDFAESLRPFSDENAAAAAVRDGSIGSYFIIAPSYRADGRVVRVSEETTFTSGNDLDTRRLRQLLRVNLVGDARLAERLETPLNVQMEVVDATSSGNAETSSGFSFALAILLMFAIVNGSGWLVQAVAEEKENRTIELVLTSVRPIYLMTGKLFGLGFISLLQLIVWLGLGSTLSGSSFGGGGLMGGEVGLGPIGGDIPASMWALALVYFLGGFLLLGSLMMALGAVGASVRESGQLSSVFTLPVIAPIWFGSAILANPDSLFARILSFVPLTAPVTMMLRLGVGPVAPWQTVTSLVVLTLSVVGALWIAARLFRAATLLTGVKPTPRVLWEALTA